MKKSRWLTRGILFVAILTICLFSTSTDAFAAEPAENPQYTVTSVEEIVEIVRSYAVMREGNFIVTYLSETAPQEISLGGVFQEIEEGLFAHTGVGSEGDYLRKHWVRFNCHAKYAAIDAQSGLYAYVFDYGDIGAMTTAEQEAQVDAKIAELFEEWQIHELSDYHKVRKIYDYICSHVVYDHEHLDDTGYTLHASAYAALIDGTAVCQGYANLFYRMANDAGVDARYVTSIPEENHGWNMVQIDGKYYWLDATWDASDYYNKYWFFLAGAENEYFHSMHTPNDDWSAYPISQTDYPCPEVTSVKINTLPDKLVYTQGDLPDNNGLSLQVTYSDGYTETITAGMYVTDIDSAVVGTQTVTVFYGGQTATYQVVVNVGPENWTYGGTCGDLSWTLTQQGVLTISGEGAMQDFYTGYREAPWWVLSDKIKSLVIEDGITNIGNYAFYNLYRVTAVSMPDSVTRIGANAFSYCYNLADVRLSNGLLEIGEDAFLYCESLTQITLPNSVTTLGAGAFANCTALSNVQIGEHISFIGADCFYNTAYYNAADNWQNGALYLEHYLLATKANVIPATFEVPAGTVLIAEGAFTSRINLETLILPTSVKYINAGAFYGCTNLQLVSYAGSSVSWNQMQIGEANEALFAAEIRFGKMKYDFIITTDENLALSPLASLVHEFVLSDDTVAQVVSEYVPNVGTQYVLRPLFPGSVTVYVLDGNGNRAGLYTVLIQEGAHKMEFVSIVLPATCIQPGTEKYACVYCGHEELHETELAQHSLVWDPAVPATCEKDGLTDGFHCSVCQYVATAQQVIPATGHSYFDWDPISRPNATQPGEDRRDCINCDHFETRPVRVSVLELVYWPNKLTYLEGEEFDPTGMLVLAYYDNGTFEYTSAYGINGYSSTPGTKTITVICGGKTVSFEVYVQAKGVEYLELNAKPNKLTYLEGDDFDPTGLVVTAYFNNGTSEVITDYTIDGYDSTPGSKFIWVSYGGAGVSFEVYVQARSLESIKVTTKPNKLTYLEGESFNPAGMVVTAYYNNGTSDVLTSYSYSLSGYDSAPGTKTIWVSHEGRQDTFLVTVQARSLVSVSVTTKPNKLTYLEGESFNAAGMVVTAYYNNNTNAPVTGYTVSGYSSTPGTKTITVSYGGKSATFNVTVTAKSFSSIKVTTKPNKLTYLEGESFSTAGMVVTAYYNNGTNAPVTGYTVSGYSSTPGTKTITVSYGGKTATFTVTVNAKPVETHDVYRIYGSNRFDTAFGAANMLKETLGVSKFDNIIVACGTNFADALAGSYLGKVKNAPILLVQPNMVPAVRAYIEANLQPGGTVYLLGGETIVPGGVTQGLNQFTTKRLWGANRYETNLAILEEAGVTGGEILVCTGYDFADSLSASAVGKPILLVDKKLTAGQEAYLNGLKNDSYVIVGGIGAVNQTVETSLRTYGSVERLAGANRFVTSVMVAERFFEDPTCAVVAYAANFPDGLCGGPLAMSMGGPLLLTANNDAFIAAEYTAENGICDGIVLGGPGLISDAAVRQIFAMKTGDSITVK